MIADDLESSPDSTLDEIKGSRGNRVDVVVESVVVGTPVLELAGVMSGRFNDAIAVEAMSTSIIPIVRANLGIAGVVPAYKLQEILFSPELAEFREKHSKVQPATQHKAK